MARQRKDGPRTKSGRLSRAYTHPDVRDQGTLEGQAKRKALVGEHGDPSLAESSPGMLFANGYLDRDQYAAALEYRQLWCILNGNPWPGFAGGSTDASEERILEIKERFEARVSRLSTAQRQIVTNVCVFDYRPTWFFAERLHLVILPEDLVEKETLLSGLSAMLGRRQMNRAA